jgi:hypothetical protein
VGFQACCVAGPSILIMNLINNGGELMFWCIVIAILIAGVVYGYKVLSSKATPSCPYIGDSACSGNCTTCAVAANRDIVLRVHDRN